METIQKTCDEAACSLADGSDWTPAQWLQAFLSKIGEYARERCNFELGLICFDVYQARASQVLTDAQRYLDLLTCRTLDAVPAVPRSDPASELQKFIAYVGEYANWRTKFERSDIDHAKFNVDGMSALSMAIHQLQQVRSAIGSTPIVTMAHPQGVRSCVRLCPVKAGQDQHLTHPLRETFLERKFSN